MHRRTSRIHALPAAALLLMLALAAPPAYAGGQDDATIDVNAIWNDPVFQRQFIGAYGMNSEVEPRVTPEEVAVLEKVRPLMGTDLRRAEELLRKQMKPDCSAVLDFTLGGIQFQQDRMPEALENYRKAVAKFPSFRRAWRNLGLVCVRGGQFDDSIGAFTRMIELGGGDAYSFGLLGYAYASKEDYLPAEAAYRNALLLQPENTEWRLGLTRCVFKQEKFAEASTLLDVLIARYPAKSEFWLLQAHAYLGLGERLRAAENLEAIDTLGQSTVDSLHTLGDIYVTEGLLDLASVAYRRALDRDPAQPLDRALRAAEVLAARNAIAQSAEVVQHLHRTRDENMVEADRRRLLKLEARLNMAGGEGSIETAAVLEELVRLDPLDGEALMLLGQHCSRQNEPDRAMLYYERAASIDAFEAPAKVRQAQVLVGLGRYAEAVPLLRRAQEVRPREDIARYLESVERLSKARR
jgi:tetratricopeptide (TPR) repeat protein